MLQELHTCENFREYNESNYTGDSMECSCAIFRPARLLISISIFSEINNEALSPRATMAEPIWQWCHSWVDDDDLLVPPKVPTFPNRKILQTAQSWLYKGRIKKIGY